MVINIETNYLKNEMHLNYGFNIKSLEPTDYGADSNAETFKLLIVILSLL